MTSPLRVLFLSDTHLGFDMPARPRVERRRRGPDFYRMFALAMEAARREHVDLVVHGGDVFHRSRVRDDLVLKALDLVRPVAETGIPVVIVPGNHERSVLPLRLLWTMPNLHVFATLSPVPGFRPWLEQVLGNDELRQGERELLPAAPGRVLARLADANWSSDEATEPALKSLCARYLTTKVNDRAIDPVANFHLANGAAMRVAEHRKIGHPGEEIFSVWGTAASFRGSEGPQGDHWFDRNGSKALTDEEMRDPLPEEFRKAMAEDGLGLGGHGGSHAYLVNEFVAAIGAGRAPAIDVKWAARFMAAGAMAHKSALAGGRVLEVPAFE